MCVKIHADVRTLTSDVSEESLRVSQKFYPENSCGIFVLKCCGVWSSDAGKSTMISKSPASLR